MDYLRDCRRSAASETTRVLDIKHLHLPCSGCTYDLGESIQHAIEHTKCYFPSHPALSLGERAPGRLSEPRNPLARHGRQRVHFEFQQMAILQATQYLHLSLCSHPSIGTPPGRSPRVGIVNFVCATRMGEEWRTGADGPEATIFRSSTLSRALESPKAKPFYDAHDKRWGNDTSGWYSDALVFSPRVVIFRDDEGGWWMPFEVDVVTCAPVDAREVRQRAASVTMTHAPAPTVVPIHPQPGPGIGPPVYVITIPAAYDPRVPPSSFHPYQYTSHSTSHSYLPGPMVHSSTQYHGIHNTHNSTSAPTGANSDIEARMRDVMKARLTRVLLLFEHRGVTNLVLGIPAAGISGHAPDSLISIWAEVLRESDKLKQAFDRIVFAVPSGASIALLQDLLHPRQSAILRRPDKREAAPLRKVESHGSMRVRIAEPIQKTAPKPPLKSILKKYPSKR
jgi:uncharacterized protein (TIGR02452 family)